MRVLLFAETPRNLLEQFSGKASIEALTFDHTFLSREDIQVIGSLPNLKSLCLPMPQSPSDLDGIRNHRSLQNLYLSNAPCDQKVIPLLRSLPRLVHLTIRCDEPSEAAERFKHALRAALPNCEFRFVNEGK